MSKESEPMTEFIDLLSKRLYKIVENSYLIFIQKQRANKNTRVILKDNFQMATLAIIFVCEKNRWTQWDPYR